MPSWKIRPAHTRDADALTSCIDAAYANYKDQISDLPAVSEGVRDHIKHHLVWVADADRSVVGGLILIPDDGFALLANLAVDPNSKKQGLGRRLIERAEEECLRLGLRELRLTTHAAMPDALGLYEHLGWKVTAKSGNKVHMTKFL